MLLQLLRLVVEAKGSLTLQALARSMRVGEGTLKLMLEQLVSLGYLDRPRQATDTDPCEPTQGCGGCHGCCSQSTESSAIWNATAKGRRLVQEESQKAWA